MLQCGVNDHESHESHCELESNCMDYLLMLLKTLELIYFYNFEKKNPKKQIVV